MRAVWKSCALLATLLSAPVVSGQRVVSQRPVPSADRGPVLGYLLDSNATSYEVVWGTPGSATVGYALTTGTSFERAVVSPNQEFAIGAETGSSQVSLARFSFDRSSSDPIPHNDALLSMDRLALSPTGTSAVVYDEGRRTFWVLSGLPDSPKWRAAIDFAAFAAPITALAVSDDGEAVVVAVADEDRGLVYGLSPDVGVRFLFGAEHITAASFLRGSLGVVFAENRRNQIDWIPDVTGPANLLPLADEHDGVAAPIGLQVSADNTRIVVANSNDSVLLVDFQGGATLTACECRVQGLWPLRGGAEFLVSDSAGPLWLYDGDALEPRFEVIGRTRSGRPARRSPR